jgi:hypothetical protein
MMAATWCFVPLVYLIAGRRLLVLITLCVFVATHLVVALLAHYYLPRTMTPGDEVGPDGPNAPLARVRTRCCRRMGRVEAQLPGPS